MMWRIVALFVVMFWLVMMTWLGWHDVWPAWTAQDPPKTRFEYLPARGVSRSQVGIFDHRGYRVGTVWTTYTHIGQTVSRDDVLWIERFPALPPTRIEIESFFDANGLLDEIQADVFGYGVALEFKGERFPREFAFEVTVGHLPLRTFKIPHTHAGAFGDMFRPFATLHDLHVGQAWRMQMFNPVAVACGLGDTFTPLLVRVTGTERLIRNGAVVECFVVEAAGARALVRPDGVVYEQSVELPIGGTIVVRDEPFDDEEFCRVKSMKLSDGTEVNRG